MEKQSNAVKISVIIPCYKGERFIAACLDNVLGQTYQMKFEVIVVIDGDIDRSASIAKAYPVKVIVLKENQGLSAARNIGLEAATGEYVHFMDVDDKVNEEFYANMAVALYDTDADIACAGMINERMIHKCQIFNKIKEYTSSRGKLSVTWVVKWGYVWRYVFRRSFLMENDLKFEVGRFIEDRYFSFTALYFARKVITVPGANYTYRCTEGSIMNKKDWKWKKQLKEDNKHSKELVNDFASSHNVSAPGLPWNLGILLYIFRKYYIVTMSHIFKEYYYNPLSARYVRY